MSQHYNDSPIDSESSDLYGVTPFAKSIATSIRNINGPIGTAIALNGPWGSGKSSVVNIIRSELDKHKDNTLLVTDFKCWWYRGEEALALAFLQNLHATLHDGLGDKIKDLIPKLSKNLLQAGSVVGQTVAMASGQVGWKTLIKGSSDYIEKTFFSEADTVEKSFKNLADILEKQEKRFLVVIDDIDRLTPEEALATFRLIKSVGRLPNVMYLLVFDRELAEKTVNERYPSEGPHFLEKIIQAAFEVPNPIQSDLNEAILSFIGEICGRPKDNELRRFMNIFYDVVAPHIITPRHVVRFRNAISVVWPAIKDELSIADFVALETIRLYEPGLYNAIRNNKSLVCGTSNQDQREEVMDLLVTTVPESHRERATIALQRIFPKLESMGYGGDWLSTWKSEKRVCIESTFDTYFRLSLSSDALPAKQIEELIENAGDKEYITETMLNAVKTIRKNGKSMVPVFLDELNAHASRIERQNVPNLIGTLFEVFENINIASDADRGFMAMANTGLRYHWLIRRLTENRFSIEEKSELYNNAIPTASMEWAADFARSALSQFDEDKNRQEEDYLVDEGTLPDIIDVALTKLRESAGNMSLMHCTDLVSTLYTWGQLMSGDFSEVKSWTTKVIDDDEMLLSLAKALVGESWSMGMPGFGALGDRVSMSTKTVRLNNDSEIVDVNLFKTRLEQLRGNPELTGETSEFLDMFFEAWSNSRNS